MRVRFSKESIKTRGCKSNDLKLKGIDIGNRLINPKIGGKFKITWWKKGKINRRNR